MKSGIWKQKSRSKIRNWECGNESDHAVDHRIRFESIVQGGIE